MGNPRARPGAHTRARVRTHADGQPEDPPHGPQAARDLVPVEGVEGLPVDAPRGRVCAREDQSDRPPWAACWLSPAELGLLGDPATCDLCGTGAGLTRWLRYDAIRCARHDPRTHPRDDGLR